MKAQSTPFIYVDPTMHALSLVHACGGDVEQARCIARDNAINAPDHDDQQFLYWDHVRKSLMPDVRQESWN